MLVLHYLSTLFSVSSTRARRRTDQLQNRICKTALLQESAFVIVSNVYNKLPGEIDKIKIVYNLRNYYLIIFII